MARVEFAMLAIPRFAILVDRYFNLKEKQKTPKPSIWRYVPVSPPIRHPIAFLKKPLWPPGSSWHDKLVFPLKYTLSLVLVVEATLAVGQVYPIFLTEGLWLALPILTCLLPTVGWTIGKGLRRSLGVIVGGILAILIVYLNPLDAPAITAEAFIVVTLGRFLFMNPRVGYLGIQMVYTFGIVGISNALDDKLSSDQRLHLALLRMLCTLIGLCIAIALSLLAFPSFCGRRLAIQTSKEIACASSAVTALVRGMISNKHKDVLAEGEPPTVVEVGTDLLKEDSARTAEQPWFREESTFRGLVDVSSTRCSISPGRLDDAQDDVSRLSRSAVLVSQVFGSCDKRMSSSTDRLLLDPIRPLLADLAAQLDRSALALDRALRSEFGTTDAVNAAADTLDLMLYLYATFDENRTKLLFSRTWAAEGEVTNSTHMIEVMSSGGGVGLHEAIHAINAFIEDWVTVVNKLLACQLGVPHPPIEESVLPPDSKGDDSLRLRARADTCIY